jgi:glycosyltransferase involved in cell wall biosynthesis
MKILQVLTDTDRRGAQVFGVDLGEALARRGHQIRTTALVRGSNREALAVEPLGRSRRSAMGPLRSAAAEADVVIAHGSSTLIACAAVSLVSRTPFVYRQISDPRFWASTWSRRLRVGVNLRRARLTVALSKGSARVLHEHVWVPDNRLRVVPNGVPAAGFDPADESQRRLARQGFGLDPDRPVITFAAALVVEKGAHLAVACLARLEQAQLLVAGDGPERAALEELAQQVAPGRVVFCGSLADVAPAYHAADVVAFPSLGGDSMPATLIEAGFCAVPVVASDVGSIADIVIDGETGVLVAPGDVERFEAGVTAVLSDGSQASAMAVRAQRHCLDQFEIDRVAGQWEVVLEEATHE